MKNKKGFTLVELLAVIVILAIIAVIATPIVLNMITKARKNAARTSALGYVDAIEYNNGFADVDQPGYTKVTGTKQVSELSEIKLKGKRPSSGTVTISDKGTVTRAELCINGYTVTYENREATVGDKCGGESTPAQTYTAYSIGDAVQINGTDWYVIADSGSSESTVKLMSKWNMNDSANSRVTASNLFRDETNISGYSIEYDTNNSNVYANSSIKVKLEGDFKSAIEGALDITVNSIGMWGQEELETLGCTVTWVTNAPTEGATNITCDNTKSWYNNIFKTTSSWINIPRVASGKDVWSLKTNGSFSPYSANTATGYGIRPVITIDKSNLD